MDQTDSQRSKANTILFLNQQAMKFLKTQNYRETRHYLSQAFSNIKQIKPSNSRNKLLAVSYTNLGNYYKLTGDNKRALQFLQKAVQVQKTFIDAQIIATTQLGMCVLLSQQGNHEKALRHAQKAQKILQQSENRYFLKTLLISYHNVGIQYQYLDCFQQALHSYYQGYKQAENSVFNATSLQLVLKESYDTLKEKIGAAQKLKTVKKVYSVKKISRGNVDNRIKSNQRQFQKQRGRKSAVNRSQKDFVRIRAKSVNIRRERKVSKKTHNKFSKPVLFIQKVFRKKLALDLTRKLILAQNITRKFRPCITTLQEKKMSKSNLRTKSKSIKSLLIPLQTDVKLKKIQVWWRAKLVRIKYLEKRAAAIIIQKHVRRKQCQNLYGKILEAVLYIQECYRYYRL